MAAIDDLTELVERAAAASKFAGPGVENEGRGRRPGADQPIAQGRRGATAGGEAGRPRWAGLRQNLSRSRGATCAAGSEPSTQDGTGDGNTGDRAAHR